ncbi:UNVERIFIED_CONTAM: hypothetical protein FKN15_019963 [Acipenser sinensis]
MSLNSLGLISSLNDLLGNHHITSQFYFFEILFMVEMIIVHILLSQFCACI